MSGLHQKQRSGYEQISLAAFQSQEDLSRSSRRDSIPTVTSHAHDNMSINSAAPLQQQSSSVDTGYPPVSQPSPGGLTPVHESRVQFSPTESDVEANKEARSYPQMPTPEPSPGRGHIGKSPSWDLLSGYKKFEHSYEEFDTRNASEKHLVFADGDVPNTAVSIASSTPHCWSHTKGVPQIVRPIISLSFERFNYHSLDYFYRPRACYPLDPWNPFFHDFPSRYRTSLRSLSRLDTAYINFLTDMGDWSIVVVDLVERRLGWLVSRPFPPASSILTRLRKGWWACLAFA